MNRYYYYLFRQFIESMGAKNIDINSDLFLEEFLNWIELRKLISNNYIDLLDYMNLSNFRTSNTMEIGKGKLDTIVESFDTLFVIPFYNKEEKNKIIKANFIISNSIPNLIRNINEDKLKKEKISIEQINTFMTQNPYTQVHNKNWEQLHNSNNYNIIVGIYGNIYDKDKEEKIKKLKLLKEKLYVKYQEEYTEIEDTYCYVLASKKKKI